jgi:hypothetical protein
MFPAVHHKRVIPGATPSMPKPRQGSCLWPESPQIERNMTFQPRGNAAKQPPFANEAERRIGTRLYAVAVVTHWRKIKNCYKITKK